MVVWHYQMSPNDPFDHDNITAIVLGELTINGKPTKVLLQAARNGFFYVRGYGVLGCVLGFQPRSVSSILTARTKPTFV
jgi:glucose dehydrogenase